MSTTVKRFHQMLREAREAASQTPEVMAVLLGMEPHDYESLENGLRYPNDETLRRLCMMLEWNYYETQRLLINEMIAPGGVRRHGAGDRHGANGDPAAGGAQRPDTLGSRLREVRLVTGQSVEIIAMLLGIDAETYRRIEAGESHPTDAVLRRISMVCNWNYNDLLGILRAEQARVFQPRRMGSAYPAASERSDRLRGLLQEMEQLFPRLPVGEQDTVLAQLRLIRDTMQQHAPQQGEPSAAGGGDGGARNASGNSR